MKSKGRGVFVKQETLWMLLVMVLWLPAIRSSTNTVTNLYYIPEKAAVQRSYKCTDCLKKIHALVAEKCIILSEFWKLPCVQFLRIVSLFLLSLLPSFFSRWERSLVRISLISFCDQETKARSHHPQLVSSTAPFWSQFIFVLLKTWWLKISSRKQAWTLLSGFYEVWTHLNGWSKDCNYWGHQREAWLNLTNSLVCFSCCFPWSFLCYKTELVFTCPFWHKQTFLHDF